MGLQLSLEDTPLPVDPPARLRVMILSFSIRRVHLSHQWLIPVAVLSPHSRRSRPIVDPNLAAGALVLGVWLAVKMMLWRGPRRDSPAGGR
jgi:hypothetical protein